MPVLSRPGSWRFGAPSYGPSPTIAPCPTTTSLSRIARSITAPARITESNITIESRTTAPTSTRTPGESTLLTTVPSITQPWLIRLRGICARRGEVALGLLRVLRPLGDAVRVVHRQDAHARGVGEGHPANRDGHLRAMPAMRLHERLVVHLVDVVAGEHHDRVGGRALDD